MSPNETSTSPGDLTVTALYTSQVWTWGAFDGAQLFATKQARDVFNATNLALGVMRAFRRGIPSLRHSLAQRHAMIDYLMDELMDECAAPQVLELAAGLCQRGASTTSDPTVSYVEVDLPGVVDKKLELLARTAEGRTVAARDNLSFVRGDITELALDSLVDAAQPVCVITEGILMYLDADAQRALWQRLAALCRRAPGSALVFDLVPFCEQPKPGALGKSLSWLFKRATKGGSFAFDDRTREDLRRDLHDAGFATVETFEPRDIASAWGVPFADEHTQTLIWRCRC